MTQNFKIYDAGLLFGFPTHTVFKPWNYTLVDDLRDKPDLVLFGGGEDINPGLYGHGNYLQTKFPRKLTPREKFELGLYWDCALSRTKMFGVCRGFQFLNVMSKGWLLQDIKSHSGPNHPLTFDQNYFPEKPIVVNSCHHQACIPVKPTIVLASTPYEDGVGSLTYDFSVATLPVEFSEIIIEAAMFTVSDYFGYACGVQWHPEYYSFNHPVAKMTRRLVDRSLFCSQMEKENVISI